LSVGGAVAGGMASSNAAKKAANITAQQRAANRAWYEYNMNLPYTQRADALESIKKAREIFMERNRNAAATAAVSGASDEAVARQKEDANKVIGDTMGTIAAQGAARKDQVEEGYLNREATLAEQQRQTEIAKANAIAGAASQVSKAGANLAGAGAGFPSSSEAKSETPAVEEKPSIEAKEPNGENVDENGKKII